MVPGRTIRTRVIHSWILEDGASYNGHLQTLRKPRTNLEKVISTAYVPYDAKSDKFKLTADNAETFSACVCITNASEPIGF